MALSFVNASTIVYSATTPITPTLPTRAAGDYVIIAVFDKPDTATPATPTGWELLGSFNGGTGSAGVDTGPTRVTFFGQTDTTGSIAAPAIVVSGLSVAGAQSFAYRVASGKGYSISTSGGADTTAGTGYSATASANPGITSGDELLAVIANTTDTPTWASETITATSATIGAVTEINEYVTTLGNDIGGVALRASVTAGTATAAPVVAGTSSGTNSAATSGAMGIVRIREVTPQNLTASVNDDTGLTDSASSSTRQDAFFGGEILSYVSAANVTSSGAQNFAIGAKPGQLVCVVLFGVSNGITYGLTDSKGHTWQSLPLSDTASAVSGFTSQQVFYTVVTSELTTSDTLTGTRSTSGSLGMYAFTINGSDGTLDNGGASVKADGSTNPAAPATLSVAAKSVVVEVAAINGLFTLSPTSGSGYSAEGTTKQALGTSNRSAGAAYREYASADAAAAPSMTMSTAQVWAAQAFAFKALPAGSNFTASPADSAGLTDSLVIDLSLSIADSENITDGGAPVALSVVLAPDAVGLSDSAAPLKTVAVSDNENLTDATVSDKVVGLSDSENLTDAQVFTRAVVLSDSENLTDTVLTEHGIPLSDAVGLTDATTVLLSHVFTAQVDDPVNMTDVAAKDLVVSQSDNENLTDATTVSIGRGVTISDTVGLTDATAEDEGEVVADAVGLTDAVTTLKTVGLADSENLTDSQTFIRSQVLADSENITDGSQSLIWLAVGSDPVFIGDTVDISLSGGTGGIVDDTGLTDSLTIDRTEVQADAVGLTDTLAFTRSQVLADSENLTDVAGRNISIPVVESEFLSDTAALTRSMIVGPDSENLSDGNQSLILLATGSDPVFLGDDVTVALSGGTGILVDDTGLVDSLAIDQREVQTDSVGVTDTTVRSFGSAPVDAENVTDSLAFVRFVTINDSIGVTESVSVSTSTPGATLVNDTAGVTDTGQTKGFTATGNDPVTIGDTVSVSLVFTGIVPVAVDDEADVTDISAQFDVGEDIADSAGVTDTIIVDGTHTYQATIADSVGITDARTVTATHNVTVSDNIGVIDTRALQRAIAMVEAIGIVDAMAIAKGFSQVLSDTVTISDSRAVSTAGTVNWICDAEALIVNDFGRAAITTKQGYAAIVGHPSGASIPQEPGKASIICDF